jgi:hypothetical protein
VNAEPERPAAFPTLRSVVLDTTDARALGEFYRQLLGYKYRGRESETRLPASARVELGNLA